MNIPKKRKEICAIIKHEVEKQNLANVDLRKALQRPGSKFYAAQKVVDNVMHPEKEYEFLTLLMLLDRLGLGISITKGGRQYKEKHIQEDQDLPN